MASAHLTARGFEVLDRNFRTRHGELDLVVRDPRHLVFCEVKTRVARQSTGAYPPLSSVGPDKRRRLRRMAREWLRERAREPRPGQGDIRFDAIGVTVSPDGRLLALEHLEAAFW